MNLLIKNVNIIDYNKSLFGDVYIENGKIKEVSTEINKENVQILNGEGKVLMPSFIDTHAHFREPGLTYKEDIETGSKAAVKGGYTGVCLMANTSPICSTVEVVNKIRERAKAVGLIDIQQCVSITDNFKGSSIAHLDNFIGDKELRTISDDGIGVMNSEVMYKALVKAKENNWVVMSHAEDHTYSKTDMRLAENVMTTRDVELAKKSGGRLHMAHVSTKEAIRDIEEGKKAGANITCEVTPHHIYLTSEVSNYRVNPPIREKEDVEALHQAIKSGIVDCIGTDHAPHTVEDKAKGAPGMVGLETAFSICNTALVKGNVISINRLSELLSKNSAEILAMNKGRIEEGFDGDLVLVDLDKKIKVNSSEFHSKGRNTPFEGMEFYGEILKTIKMGKIVYSL